MYQQNGAEIHFKELEGLVSFYSKGFHLSGRYEEQYLSSKDIKLADSSH